jgi:hypothetical protein
MRAAVAIWIFGLLVASSASARQLGRLRLIRPPPHCRDLLVRQADSLRGARSRDLKPAGTQTSAASTETPSEFGTGRRRGTAKPSSSAWTLTAM